MAQRHIHKCSPIHLPHRREHSCLSSIDVGGRLYGEFKEWEKLPPYSEVINFTDERPARHDDYYFPIVTLKALNHRIGKPCLVEWLFGQNPEIAVMTGSYNEILSTSFARKVRDTTCLWSSLNSLIVSTIRLLLIVCVTLLRSNRRKDCFFNNRGQPLVYKRTKIVIRKAVLLKETHRKLVSAIELFCGQIVVRTVFFFVDFHIYWLSR